VNIRDSVFRSPITKANSLSSALHPELKGKEMLLNPLNKISFANE
jgi:hypothetical protein